MSPKTTQPENRDLNLVGYLLLKLGALGGVLKPHKEYIKSVVARFRKNESKEKRIKVSRHFYLDEFIDPHTYFNNDDHGLSLIDDRLFEIAELLRVLYGKPIYINNWWSFFQEHKNMILLDELIVKIETNKDLNKWSGTRTKRTSIGARFSAHKILKNRKCQAIDPKGNEQELFYIVKTHAKTFYKLGVRRLEDISITDGWLHIDTLERNTKPNSIRVVDRTKSTETITF